MNRVLRPDPPRSPYKERMVGVVTFLSPLIILVVWEICARLGAIDTRLFSSPAMILEALVPLVTSGELIRNIGVSVWRIMAGFTIGSALGIVLGLSMGLFPLIRAALQPLVASTFPIPKLAIMPLILLVFGLGETSKIAIVAIGVFYLVLINTMAGVVGIDRIHMDVAKGFGTGKLGFYRTVALPGAMPMIFAGLKLGMGTALILIVAAEMSASQAGVGYMIWRAYDMFAIERMFVGLITMSVLGYLFSYALDWFEGIVIPWRRGR